LTRLLQAADYDVAKPKEESFFIDEIDKIPLRVTNLLRDVSGRSTTVYEIIRRDSC
jgi:ATP-dependent protease Clp ATPase subunit